MAKDPQVRAVIRGLKKVTERVMTKITLDVTANLIGTTPVDTGWARANWVPAIGKPASDDLTGIKPTTQLASGAAAKQQSAQASVLTYKLPQGSISIANNVPYIERLNEGSSKQAPAAFVQRAIRKAVTQDIKVKS